MPKKTKPNPQDATLRNIRALKKRVAELETTVDQINERIEKLGEVLDTLTRTLRAV